MAGYDDRSYPTANDDYAMGVPVTLASDGRPNYVPLAEPVVVSGTPLVDSVPMGVAVGGGVDYLVKFEARTIDSYQRLMDKWLVSEVGIERYFTYIVTKTVKHQPIGIDPSAAL